MEGKSFTEAQWVAIVKAYANELDSKGSCTVRRLADLCKISFASAKKAIDFYDEGIIRLAPKGHGRRGIGTLKELTAKQHYYIYNLFSRKPSRPLQGYKDKLYNKFGLKVSTRFISNWFKEIGPFKKRTMRATSMFPPNKNSREVVARLEAYREFLDSLPSHKNIVFADEKVLKEVDCYRRVRRDPMTGVVYANHCANSRNRWNILAAINVKKNVEDNCYALVLKEKGDSDCFQEYVELLISNGFLESGDILIVDNGTIRTAGENEHLQEVLWQDQRILMLTLPPYHSELNPIELLFNDLVQVLTRENARGQNANMSFRERLVRFFLGVKRRHVIEMYRAQRYRV